MLRVLALALVICLSGCGLAPRIVDLDKTAADIRTIPSVQVLP